MSAFDYLNDALSRRTQRIDSGRAGPPDPPVTNRFGYNLRSELTSAAMGTNQFGYAYDPIGNRTTASNNNEATTYAANTLNQYTNIMAGAIQVPQYDLDGNLTNYNGWTFVWDAENRLISAEQVGTAVPDVRIAYDYMSRRIEKAVNGVTNRFVYDGWDLISETTSTGITNVYVWGVDLSGSLQGSGGIGGLVSVTMSGAGVPPATYIPCYDANGNITDYVDTNSTVVAHREFDAFGNTTVATGPQVNDFNFWFSTKYLDQETGLYYYGYRFLSTDWGRWVNRDPITEGGGLNLNCFVNNNSLANVDANGLWILGPVNPGNDVPPIVESPPPRPPIQPGPRKCCGYASYNTITQCCCESTKKIHDLGSPFQWSGTIAYSEFGYYLQFTAMNCDLKSNIRSDCKRFTVNITAFLGGLTYGPAYGGVISQITFNNSPSFYEGFNGGVSFIGVGASIVGGLSVASIRIGDGVTIAYGPELGFELPSGAILVGHTFHVDGMEIPCDKW